MRSSSDSAELQRTGPIINHGMLRGTKQQDETHRIVDVRIAELTNIPHKARHSRWALKERDDLVYEVRAQIVDLTTSWQFSFLPVTFQTATKPIIAATSPLSEMTGDRVCHHSLSFIIDDFA